MKTDNELIAEFMEFTRIGVHGSGAIIWGNVPGPIGHCIGEEFDTQWNWLMPVVEKINTSEVGDILKTDADWEEFEKLSSLNIFTPIDKVYIAVVGFIKWYNTHSLGTN